MGGNETINKIKLDLSQKTWENANFRQFEPPNSGKTK